MKTFFSAIALSLMLAGCSDNRTPPAKVAIDNQPATDANAGKTIAERACKACHGSDGQGAAPGIPRLASQRAPYLLASLIEYKNGKRPHAAFKAMSLDLTEIDMRNVAEYYARLAPKATSSAHDTNASSPYEEGKALAGACSTCHGEHGNSVKSGIPTLAGQQPHYLVNAVRRQHRAERSTASFDFEAIELEKVALYFSSQTPVQRAAPRAGNPEAGRATAVVCGGCHGVDGVSHDASTASLAGQDAQYLAQAMNAYRTTRQHGALQRYIAGLTDQDIADIAAFFAVQQPRAAEQSANATRELAEKCDRCHDAEDAAVPAPILRGQDRDYLIMSLRGYRDGRRGNATMHHMSSVYGNVVIESIATWYADQPIK